MSPSRIKVDALFHTDRLVFYFVYNNFPSDGYGDRGRCRLFLYRVLQHNYKTIVEAQIALGSWKCASVSPNTHFHAPPNPPQAHIILEAYIYRRAVHKELTNGFCRHFRCLIHPFRTMESRRLLVLCYQLIQFHCFFILTLYHRPVFKIDINKMN